MGWLLAVSTLAFVGSLCTLLFDLAGPSRTGEWEELLIRVCLVTFVTGLFSFGWCMNSWIG